MKKDAIKETYKKEAMKKMKQFFIKNKIKNDNEIKIKYKYVK